MRCAFLSKYRSVFLGHFHELPQDLHGDDEFLRELPVLLVLPRAAKGRKPRLKGRGSHLDVLVETFQFVREEPDLFGIHDCLSHRGGYGGAASGD